MILNHQLIICLLLFVRSTAALSNQMLIISHETKNHKVSPEARQLERLLSHFNRPVTIKNKRDCTLAMLSQFDVIFYEGIQAKNKSNNILLKNLLNTHKTIVWVNSYFAGNRELYANLGFSLEGIDTSRQYTNLFYHGEMLKRSHDNLIKTRLLNQKAKVLVSAASTPEHQIPYVIKSDQFYFVAECPFKADGMPDPYLLFADLLHEITGEKHQEQHRAIVRIEDITPLRDPSNLMEMADVLFEHKIPFLLSVIPFYVDPSKGERISLSERPELSEALRYCVQKGGTIVLHGVTHQYTGLSAIDYEFWDIKKNKPIRNQKVTDISQKIETGIQECMKNGLYPMLWETPHYMGSDITYRTVAKYFGAAIEKRLSSENYCYNSNFPFVVEKDLYGQKLYPENLGYVPLLDTRSAIKKEITEMIQRAKSMYLVRDGYASFYYHSFLETEYLKDLVEGICSEGFQFVDFKMENNWQLSSF